ncbi:hydrolase [Vibrio sp. SS-MA-C1-2]|uniref:hydrolase n=1 Tax=Vibrio sp. SS-MA-C1-2 TaxID=2908646 RepID=UPI001F386F03|nr:hydrolase [Vibrio sp. SS-MA-C1-2]UJF17122.1 hydrolase [Vibrio sp. SS-MA-C1-2]
MPFLENCTYTPPWWAKNPHVQTILPLFTKHPKLKLCLERLELHDGDFLDLHWLKKPKANQTILVILHGLEGCSESHYIRRLFSQYYQLPPTVQQQFALVVHHHRGCSGEPNRLSRSYHSGDTEDIQSTLKHLKCHYPNSRLIAVGYSLGGNVLAKYLGEHQQQSLIQKAVIVSAPLSLASCAKRLEKGFSTIYQRYLIRQLQAKIRQKALDPNISSAIPVMESEIHKLNTFYNFDNKVTAPLAGFSDASDYYKNASGLPFLSDISKPTLIIHAQDDPFMTASVVPSETELSEFVNYELQQYGGHVGFIDGGWPWKPNYYLEKRVFDFLQS